MRWNGINKTLLIHIVPAISKLFVIPHTKKADAKITYIGTFLYALSSIIFCYSIPKVLFKRLILNYGLAPIYSLFC